MRKSNTKVVKATDMINDYAVDYAKLKLSSTWECENMLSEARKASETLRNILMNKEALRSDPVSDSGVLTFLNNSQIEAVKAVHSILKQLELALQAMDRELSHSQNKNRNISSAIAHLRNPRRRGEVQDAVNLLSEHMEEVDRMRFPFKEAIHNLSAQLRRL